MTKKLSGLTRVQAYLTRDGRHSSDPPEAPWYGVFFGVRTPKRREGSTCWNHRADRVALCPTEFHKRFPGYRLKPGYGPIKIWVTLEKR